MARRIVNLLRPKLGRQLVAAGVGGSVARGTAEALSDIDLVILVKKLPVNLPRYKIVDATYCSINYITWKSALSELSQPSDELPQILGGYEKIRPISDPSCVFRKLEEKASSITPELFRKSARLALLHSYEDFCRAKNAFLKRDEIVLKDCVYIVTYSAANIVASLNHASFPSDREIFKAHKRFPKRPKGFERIEQLRYGNLKGKRLFTMLVEFYIDLIEFCRGEDIRFPVDERTLRELR
jgi:hypothetical protein